MKRVLALALVLAAGASCGGNDEDKRVFAQRQGICDGLVAKGETVGQADVDYRATGLNASRGNGSAIDCQVFIPPSGSQCASGATLCKIYWQSIALDSGLCNAGNCVYACEAYTPGQSQADVTDASVVCAARFISGQPFLF